jgi:hypothetical protein
VVERIRLPLTGQLGAGTSPFVFRTGTVPAFAKVCQASRCLAAGSDAEACPMAGGGTHVNSFIASIGHPVDNVDRRGHTL